MLGSAELLLSLKNGFAVLQLKINKMDMGTH
jgi:hypothetical protein